MKPFGEIKNQAKEALLKNDRLIIRSFFIYAIILFSGQLLVTLLLYGGGWLSGSLNINYSRDFTEMIKQSAALNVIYNNFGAYASMLRSIIGLATFPMFVGCLTLCVKLINGNELNGFTIFTPYKDKSLLGKLLIIWLVFLLFNILSPISKLASNAISQIIYAIILLIAVALAIISAYFSPTLYLLAENKNLTVAQALRGSFKLIRGHFWRYMGFTLSFFLWYLIPLFIWLFFFVMLIPSLGSFGMHLGIQINALIFSTFLWGMGIYLIPYYCISLIFFFRDLAKDNLSKISG